MLRKLALTSIKKRVILFVFLWISFIAYSQNNQPPEPKNDYATADVNTTLTTPSGAPDNYPSVLENDTDPDNDNLVVISFNIGDGIWYNQGSTVALTSGTFTINSQGDYTYIPNTNFTGNVQVISYKVSDGTTTEIAHLYLTVETDEDLLELHEFSSCNQGYTIDGEYVIRYKIVLQNMSITRGDHKNSEITNIQILNDLNSIFGDNCILKVERLAILTSMTSKENETTLYPQEWHNDDFDIVEFDETNTTPGAEGIFNNTDHILYPRQTLTVEYCVHINPYCNGRVNPAISGDGIDFTNIINVHSSRGDNTGILTITDFHATQTSVSANIFLKENSGIIDTEYPLPDSRFDYTHKIIIHNEGNSIAQNVNFNLGLQRYSEINTNIETLEIFQVSGPSVNLNPNYNGILEPLLLDNGNSLNPNETIVLGIHYIVKPNLTVNQTIIYQQLDTSLTQGAIDGQGYPPTFPNEFDFPDRTYLSFLMWSDDYGNHVDRYYFSSQENEVPTSNNQCQCDDVGVRLYYNLVPKLEKSVAITDSAPNGIIEFKELTFDFLLSNQSVGVTAKDLQITDDFSFFGCANNLISISAPEIIESTATQNPIINSNYNGISNINFFDGTSGILKAANYSVPEEFIKVRIKALFNTECSSDNMAYVSCVNLLGLDPQLRESNIIEYEISNDNDHDNISNRIDIDDDNDGIPDTMEYNGLDPLDDNDNDHIPNYRDTDFGTDSNNDGIVDLFDFDLDGIPNHFDLDSDNDGIYDLVEAGGLDPDNNGLVPIMDVGTLLIDEGNGLSNSLILDTDNDGIPDTAIDPYITGASYIPNIDTDLDSHPNAYDIDSDNDGIVDNIEAQSTLSYAPPLSLYANGGVYQEGLIPIDTDGDNLPDYTDPNSDDDERNDLIEAWDLNNDGITDTFLSNTDTDNDGLDDAFDTVLDANGFLFATNNQNPLDFPNNNLTNTEERDWRELIAPIITISNAMEEEGNPLIFNITLSSISSADIDLKLSIIDDTTTLNEDYETPTNLIITIPQGSLNETFTLPTIDDTIKELDIEKLFLKTIVTSENTENLTVESTGEIIDNDDFPNLIISNPYVIEGEKLIFEISLSNENYNDVHLNIFTNNGTAQTPLDYIALTSQVTIPAKTLTIIEEIQTIDDILVEDLEDLTLKGIVTSFNTDNIETEGTGIIIDNEIPNLFSPNNDGLSDVFEVISLKQYPNFKMQFFDRWGNLVYDYKNNGNPNPLWWNGTIKGNPVPEGVYYYTIDYNNGVTQPKSGYVQLVR